jgi:hypothetical protein
MIEEQFAEQPESSTASRWEVLSLFIKLNTGLLVLGRFTHKIAFFYCNLKEDVTAARLLERRVHRYQDLVNIAALHSEPTQSIILILPTNDGHPAERVISAAEVIHDEK